MGYFKDIVCTGIIRCLSKIYASEFVGKLTGNASSASKLANARLIQLTGSVTGSIKFDGSGDVAISTTTNHTHNYAGADSSGGAAHSSCWLHQNTTLTYGASGLQYFNISGLPSSGATVNAAPTNSWYHIIRMNHQNASGFYTDLSFSFFWNDIQYRRVDGGNESGWIQMVDSANYKNYCTNIQESAPASGSVLWAW